MSSSDFDHVDWAADFLTHQMQGWKPAQFARFFDKVSIVQFQLPQDFSFGNDNDTYSVNDFNLTALELQGYSPGFSGNYSVVSSPSVVNSPETDTDDADGSTTLQVIPKAERVIKPEQKDRRNKKLTMRKAADLTVKRPKGVNAFMCFRAHHCTAFFSLGEQKLRSAFIGQLWAGDVCRREWIILAIAYSTIRDAVGKDNAPIKVFLELVCPWVGIPAPENYLSAYGYSLTEASELVQPAHFPNREEFNIRSGFTEKDVIEYCQSNGYPHELPVEETASSTMVMTVASAPQEMEVTNMMPQPVVNNVDFNMESLFDHQDYGNLYTLDGTSFDQNFTAIPQDVGISFAPETFWDLN
ncbi:hypothetical protein EJ05DRAFT_453066 [Pseudovirgaria hyperparasitica]|uniref:Mating-type protein MAT-1 n=1 Tax=Pseudovirgaria hyperparasitica TaxID=470096 RepID=A0A6A6W2Y3_9PEZI|nr:uncharacterized protein EJ05DRAFT_453066 [Pseudovirgaria hyperparasitica]KAF2757298.1 hypothetical protein EJ05DRAFT_453066 [Pseudovirgaria hyperparasitica]